MDPGTKICILTLDFLTLIFIKGKNSKFHFSNYEILCLKSETSQKIKKNKTLSKKRLIFPEKLVSSRQL